METIKRECGDCTECCTSVGVRELEKSDFERCSHICETGCNIYQDRPNGCRGYNCHWLLGGLRDEDRPDKVGIVCDSLIIEGAGEALIIRVPDEEKLKDANSKEAKFVSYLISQDYIIDALYKSGENKLFGKPETILKFMERGRVHLEGVENGISEKV